MLGALRLLFLLFVVLTLIYLVLGYVLRQIALREAEQRYEALGKRIDWETFLEREMKAYDRAMRRKLIIAVYILPTAFVAALIYFVNFA